ncbi:MAG: NlpC/P60 family protein [Gammaproteobacteria bacterium]|nr:NlpC/P60 family protein [Gammaproteobacteria bacterium]
MRVLFVVALLAVATGLGGCASFGSSAVSPAPPPGPATASAPTPQVTDAVDALGLVAYATSMQGKPYLSGGESPRRGFDCSGLVHHVFGQFNFEIPRNTAAMAQRLPSVDLADLRAADLVFFDTQGPRYSHVGIYLGDGRFVHAPSPRTGRVIISSMADQYWNQHLSGARRPSP